MNTVQMHKKTLEEWLKLVSACRTMGSGIVLDRDRMDIIMEAHREIFHANKIIKTLMDKYPDTINTVMELSGKLYRRDDDE